MLFPLNGLFYIWTYISVFIYMFPSKPCTFQCHVRDFVDFIANDCKFPVCPFSCQLALSTIFFLSLIYYFLFQGFKIELYSQVSTYTSTSISIWEETECYIMYIERWISLFWLEKLRMYKSIFSNNVTIVYMSF